MSSADRAEPVAGRESPRARRRPELRDSPPPAAVDLRRLLLVGMALWAVALLVTGGLWLAGSSGPRGALTCAAGILLGCWGLWWARGRGPSPDA